MKKSAAIAVAVCFVACSQQPDKQNEVFDEKKEQEAIMKTIEGETSSFYKRDYENWKKHYVQTAYAFQAWNNGDGSIDAKTGWPAVDAGIGNYIKSNPVEPGGSSHPVVLRRNMITKFYADTVAYLLWDQYNSTKDSATFQYSKEVRIMEKQNGEWKIVNVSAFWDYSNKMIPASDIQ